MRHDQRSRPTSWTGPLGNGGPEFTSTFVDSSRIYRTSRTGILLRAEVNLREAGRALELSVDPEIQRVGLVAFRLASRCRTDRLAAAA